MAAWDKDIKKLQDQIDALWAELKLAKGQIESHEDLIRAVESVNRDQAVTLLSYDPVITFLRQQRIRVIPRVLDAYHTDRIAMEGGTLFSIVTEVQHGPGLGSSGSVVVARDVVRTNAAKLGSASFWCEGAHLRCAGATALNYQVIFVTAAPDPQ